MEFRTRLVVDTGLRGFIKYTADRPIVMLGSCFSDNMASRLDDSLFNVMSNPFGTLYNPLSIAAAAERLADALPFTANDLVKGSDGLWHSFMHHSSFSDLNPDNALRRINTKLNAGAEALKRAQCVIVTLGTAWVFRLCATGSVVANCHKFPAREFTRERLTVTDVVNAIERIRRAVAPAPLLLTVSPVRHAADGLHGNTLSKSTLHLAVEQSEVAYFPAYEALIDDLRDYRFTASDMRHPSETACDYIFSLMCEALMTERTRTLLAEAAKFTRLARHRPLSAQTADEHHRKLLNELDSLRASGSPLAAPALRYIKNHDLPDF